MPSVVFVCVANSCRSQMAEALARAVGDPRWEIWSAGSHPSGRIHPLALQMMEELGLDLSAQRSKGITELPSRTWDYVVLMGCKDRCPTLTARHRVEWSIPDPVGIPLEEARKIRDQIKGLVYELLRTGVSSHAAPTRGTTSR